MKPKDKFFEIFFCLIPTWVGKTIAKGVTFMLFPILYFTAYFILVCLAIWARLTFWRHHRFAARLLAAGYKPWQVTRIFRSLATYRLTSGAAAARRWRRGIKNDL